MSRLPRARLLLLALPIALLAGCGGENIVIGHTPTPTSTPTVTPTATPTPVLLTSEAVLRPGPLGVGVTTVVFEDTTRGV